MTHHTQPADENKCIEKKYNLVAIEDDGGRQQMR